MSKEKYLEKIVALFKDEGLDLTMDIIAERIGVTKKTLYNQFNSKEQMIDDCMQSMTEELKNTVACMGDTSTPASVGFRTGITNMKVKMFDISHAFIRDLQMVYPNKATRDHITGSTYFVNMIRSNIERGMATGEYRDDLQPEFAAKYINFCIFNYFSQNVMRNKAISSDEYFRTVTDYHIHALMKHDNGPGPESE